MKNHYFARLENQKFPKNRGDILFELDGKQVVADVTVKQLPISKNLDLLQEWQTG